MSKNNPAIQIGPKYVSYIGAVWYTKGANRLINKNTNYF